MKYLLLIVFGLILSLKGVSQDYSRSYNSYRNRSYTPSYNFSPFNTHQYYNYGSGYRDRMYRSYHNYNNPNMNTLPFNNSNPYFNASPYYRDNPYYYNYNSIDERNFYNNFHNPYYNSYSRSNKDYLENELNSSNKEREGRVLK